MPNWCINQVAFINEDDAALPELEKLRNKLLQLLKDKKDELVDVLKEHCLNPDKFDCRGTINDIEGIRSAHIGAHHCFVIHTETAWGPTPEAWEAICEKYPGIFTVYTAEELGNGILTNTDTQGYCFIDWYRFEVWFDDKSVISKTGVFGLGKHLLDRYGDHSEYFEQENYMIDYFSVVAGRKFCSFKQAEDFSDSIWRITDGAINFSLLKFNEG